MTNRNVLANELIMDELFDHFLVVDREHRIQTANKAYLETFGIPRDDLDGKRCFEVAAGRDHSCGDVCPADRVFETGKSFSTEHSYKDRHGRLVKVDLRAFLLSEDRVGIVFRDVTQWKRAEDKLVENFKRFQGLVDASDDAIFVVNSELEIQFVNRRALKMTGYSGKELVNLDLSSIIENQEPGIFEKLSKDLDAGNAVRMHRVVKISAADQSRIDCDAWFYRTESTGGNDPLYVFFRDLSPQRQMADEHRRTNEFLTSVIERSVDGIIAADMAGKVIVFNKGAENLLGYTAEEVVGKFNVVNFYPAGVAQEIMRKLRSEDYGGAGKAIPHRITGIHKNGEQVPMTLSGATIYQDGREVATVGIFYDLREILKTEQELMESEMQFRELFEGVQHGIYFSTRDGRFLDCNQALLSMLEYETKEDFLAMEIVRDLYFDPEDRKKFQELIERDGRVKDYEISFKKKNGDPITVLLTAHLRKDPSGKVLGYQGIVVDMSDRRKLEQQLFQTEKLAAMGRLTAQIAHELNNPIYGVMNCLDLIRSEIPENSKKRKFLEMAYSETGRISQLLKSMLKFFRPEEDVKAEVDVNRLTDEVLLFLGKQLAEFKIRAVLQSAENLPPVFASGNQLKQVMLNMIMNAKNAMPNGGELTLATLYENDSVKIRIADTGVGIPAENLDLIFEAFFTTKSDVKGVGLGLSVCFGIIKEHGGEIQVQSELGVGTTFTISLPVKP
jgi:PAS domain S-box-containing protein